MKTSIFVITVLTVFLLFVYSIKLANHHLRNTSQNFDQEIPYTIYQDHLTKSAQMKANCKKPKTAQGYIVCRELPFTEINCGQCANGCPEKTPNGIRFRVPNIVHFIWFGEDLNFTKFAQYLAIRSVASIQRPDKIFFHYDVETIHSTELLSRLLKELPCVHLHPYKAPNRLYGNEVNSILYKSDVARLQILQKYGGIYMDLDVITLKPLGDLRVYPTVMGRSTKLKACNGIILSEPKSEFLRIWSSYYKSYNPGHTKGYEFFGLQVPLFLHLRYPEKGLMHLDDVLMNRPSPFVDSLNSTSFGHYSIKDNFFLHIHPKILRRVIPNFDLEYWREDKLRTLDSTYGQAARIALFGSSDLVFLENEPVHEPLFKKTVHKLPPPRDEYSERFIAEHLPDGYE